MNRSWVVRAVLAATALLLATGVAVAATRGTGSTSRPAERVSSPVPSTTTTGDTATTTSTTVAVATTLQVTTTTPATTSPPRVAGPLGAVALTGCPPPPRPPQPPSTPSHPAVLVPEASLPIPPPPSPRVTNLAPLAGKGMWIWQPAATEGGDAAAIVERAVSAHLSQLWVRVGSSFDGFYNVGFLEALVPLAHRHGLAVIGWGFPYLYDPVGDAGWTDQALAWQASSGDRLDAWSADIEAPSEGVALSAKRAATYLGLIRPHAAGRPLIATVYPPTDYWLVNYPYEAMAPAVDAFAPMVYWSCREPGDAVAAAIQRLSRLAPVHPIGQAYDMGPYGGRVGSPSGAEIARFLDVARRGGATGASFWVWQYMTAQEWSALGDYAWAPPPRVH